MSSKKNRSSKNSQIKDRVDRAFRPVADRSNVWTRLGTTRTITVDGKEATYIVY